MELAIFEGTVGCNQFERMDTKTSDTSNRSWDTARAEEVSEGVDTFRVVNMEIPELQQSTIVGWGGGGE